MQLGSHGRWNHETGNHFILLSFWIKILFPFLALINNSFFAWPGNDVHSSSKFKMWEFPAKIDPFSACAFSFPNVVSVYCQIDCLFRIVFIRFYCSFWIIKQQWQAGGWRREIFSFKEGFMGRKEGTPSLSDTSSTSNKVGLPHPNSELFGFSSSSDFDWCLLKRERFEVSCIFAKRRWVWLEEAEYWRPTWYARQENRWRQKPMRFAAEARQIYQNKT